MGAIWSIALVACALLFPRPGGWTVDDGVKQIAASSGEGVWAETVQDGKVRSQMDDPAKFPPLQPSFAQRVEQGFALGFSPLTRALFHWLGEEMLLLHVVMALVVIGLWLCFEAVGFSSAFLLLPLTFYGLVPWEHGLSWLLLWPMVWSVVVHTSLNPPVHGGRMFSAGVAAAVAMLLRPETVVLVVLLSAYLLFRGRRRETILLAAGCVITMGLFGLVHVLTAQQTIFAHFQLNLREGRFFTNWASDRGNILYELLASMDRHSAWSVTLLALFVAGVVALWWGESRRARAISVIGIVALAAWVSGLQWRLWSQPLPPVGLLGANSLFVAMPWIAVLLFPPYRARHSFILFALGTAVMFLILPVWEGVHWGPRLLLFLAPLLVIDLFATKRAQSKLFYVLLAITLLQTLSSGVLVYARDKELADRHQRLESKLGAVVLCPNMSQCVDLAPFWKGREFFTTAAPRELRQLLIEFREQGLDTCWLHLKALDPLYVKSFPQALPVWPHRMTVFQAGTLYKTQWRVYELVMNRQDTTWSEVLQAEAGALLREGKAGSALTLQREAAELTPGSASAHHNLALILADLGEMNEARAEAARALDLDSTLTEASRLWEDLKAENADTIAVEAR